MPPSDPRPSPPRTDPIAGSPVGDVFVYPPSFAQERLWFLDQLDPGASHYNIHVNTVLRGPLDVGALRRALEEIVARHEVLRTTFRVENGRPAQVIAPPGRVPLPLTDLTALPASDAELEARRVATEEARRPFDLAVGPLLRARLLKREEGQHVLVLVFHHIVFDGWSMGVFFRELSDLYEAFSSGRAAGLPDLPIQYADYAVWQRDWLQGEVLEGQLAYWKAALAGAPLSLDLPTDRPRPPAQSFRGARHSILLSKRLTEGLKELSRGEGATLYMTLLAAFQVLLLRYTNQEDIVVGSPIANRTRAEIEGLIGFFVNTLVLRGDLSGDPSFRELLKRVREVALQAYAHQDLPFEKLVEELQPGRDLGQNPLFQVLFALQNAPASALKLAGLKVAPLSVESKTTRFDLEVHLWETDAGLSGAFVYSTDLFDASTIERLSRHFQVLLEGIVADPGRGVWEFPLLTEAERRQVLEEWNQTETEYPRDKTVHGLFEEQVERTPQAVAVVFGQERLTYGQLNERANRLARYLRKLGVGPEVLVGLYVERSVEMVVGLLGILKAGGAYVPLDPSYPRRRVAFMLEDTAARVVLTQESLSESLPEGHFECVRLDADWAEFARESDENPQSQATAENLAYVIYTSGSTGNPKGVAMPHRALLNLIRWQVAMAWNPCAKTLQFASLNFDVSFQETFSTWCAGGALVLVSEDVRRDPVALWGLLESESVERLFLPFVALRQLAEAAERYGAEAPSLSEVVTAGEQLQITPQIARLFRNGLRRLQNQYGPSESHVATAHTLTGPAEKWPGLPPIGRPIANTRIYLLDRRQQPVPVGVAAELHIGGVCVARGYWNRPELTAERFLEDPFIGKPDARLYKTGDLARFRADGEIEFLGRLDHQVKIRGYRVELGEIESVLAHHPEIRACAVTALQQESVDKRLVAYVVARSDPPPSVTELRSFLKESLQDYMVPSAFVFLDSLPLTPSGKVARQALPAPDARRPELEGVFVAPRTTVEQTVAGIWSQVLGLEKVGVYDNFFDLGGHSLLATQVVSRLRRTFGGEIPLRTLFEAPSIAELALAIVQSQAAAASPDELERLLADIEEGASRG